MIKLLKYFFQATIVYFFFIVGRLIGISLSRIIFSSIFKLVAPIFKSKKIIEHNLNIFAKEVPGINKKRCWDCRESFDLLRTCIQNSREKQSRNPLLPTARRGGGTTFKNQPFLNFIN